MNCTICELPLSGSTVSIIGDGDGSGTRFAHPECYYMREIERVEAAKQPPARGILYEELEEYYRHRMDRAEHRMDRAEQAIINSSTAEPFCPFCGEFVRSSNPRIHPPKPHAKDCIYAELTQRKSTSAICDGIVPGGRGE